MINQLSRRFRSILHFSQKGIKPFVLFKFSHIPYAGSINYSLKDDTIHEPVLELDPKPTPLASLVPIEPSMIEFENNKLNSPGSSSINSDNSSSNIISSALKRQWGTEITIELNRDESKGFGISIIGGKNNKSNFTSLFSFTGILIKKILPDSPAAKSGILKIGDKLLEVDGVDLRNATHEEAVEAIKKAKSPVKFIVQSLVPMVKIIFWHATVSFLTKTLFC